VVQYFPSADYLRRVVTAAVGASSAARRRFFIGDLRSLALLETFALSVELAQAQDDVTVAVLRDRVARRLLHEHELVVAPEFFYTLRQEVPRFNRSRVLVKRGRFHNELSTYRYDVILHIGDSPRESLPLVPRSWAAEEMTVETLREELGGERGNRSPGDRRAQRESPARRASPRDACRIKRSGGS